MKTDTAVLTKALDAARQRYEEAQTAMTEAEQKARALQDEHARLERALDVAHERQARANDQYNGFKSQREALFNGISNTWGIERVSLTPNSYQTLLALDALLADFEKTIRSSLEIQQRQAEKDLANFLKANR